MNRIIPSISLLFAALAFSACGPVANNSPAANNSSANTANTNSTAPSTASADAEIKKVMAELAASLAKNDADAVAKHYSDDYQLVGPGGDIHTKAKRIADMKSGASKFESFSYDDITVRTYGDTAVAISTVRVKGQLDGRPSAPETRATLVFRKTGDTWKVVSGQATPIAASAPAGNSNTATNVNANK